MTPELVERPDGTRTFADRGLANEIQALFDRTDKGAAGLHFGLGVSGGPGKPPVMESWLAVKLANGWSVAAPIKVEWKGPWSFGIQAGKSF